MLLRLVMSLKISAGRSTRGRSRPTLLVVEEEDRLREELRRALDGEYRIFMASNVDEGLKRLRRAKYLDAVLIGVGGEGLEPVGRIRKAQPDLKLFLLSPEGDGRLAREAFRIRAEGILSKPPDLELLKNMIASRLGISAG